MCCEFISVAMGIRYRRQDTALLRRAVDSILCQGHGNIEFLICENGSTDAAKACLADYVARDSRIRLIGGKGAETLAEKLNRCIAAAKGKYIARMDDDDFSHADRLEKQVRFLEENREISFVGCNVLLIKDGTPIGERRLPFKPTVEDFYMTQPYIHPALLFRREALEAVGGYSEDTACILCEDYDLLLRMYKAGHVGANIQKPLLDYTVSDGSSRKMRHRLNEAKTRYRRFRDLGKLPGAWPYVVKPIAVGLLPKGAVALIRNIRDRKTLGDGYCKETGR